MSEQLSFIVRNGARARATDPETSHDAARSISDHLPAMERLVLDTVASSPVGMTIDEIAARLNRDKASVAPRIKPLVTKGKLYSDGTKRRGRSGRLGIVWKVRGER